MKPDRNRPEADAADMAAEAGVVIVRAEAVVVEATAAAAATVVVVVAAVVGTAAGVAEAEAAVMVEAGAAAGATAADETEAAIAADETGTNQPDGHGTGIRTFTAPLVPLCSSSADIGGSLVTAAATNRRYRSGKRPKRGHIEE